MTLDDEFSLLEETAREAGLPWDGPVPVRRETVPVGPEQDISLLVWGDAPPELVFLHGGGQNAHTWDTVVLALGRPALAVDLPGHGHSSWRADRDYWPWSNAEAVATVMRALAPQARAVVGMSLGGLTTLRLAAVEPELVRRAVVVDVTPGVGARTAAMTAEQRGTTALIQGPEAYDSFDAMLAATVATAPHRSVSSLRRGLLHNARQLDDGRWVWRYDRLTPEGGGPPDFTPLWEDVARIRVPVMLVRGLRSAHVSDEDVAEFRRRLPAVRVEDVEGAGHSVQSDKPRELAALIEDFLAS